MTQEQFDNLRADFRECLSEALAGLRDEIAAVAASPYRTRAGAAAYLGCGLTMIDGYLASGKLEKRFSGSKVLIPIASLEALIERETIAGQSKKFQLLTKPERKS